MENEISIGDTLLKQKALGENETLSREYDLIIAGLSWENRATHALSKLKDKSREITLVKFSSASTESEGGKERILAEFESSFDDVRVKDFHSSTDNSKNLASFKSWIHDKFKKKGGSLSLLIDVTCIPKSYVLFLIGLGFTDELIARVDCIYSPGTYDLVGKAEANQGSVAGPRALVSIGEWVSHQIPYFEAADYIVNDRDILVTMGGEVGLSLPFIERHEPRRLDLVFIRETAPSDDRPMHPSEKLAYEDLLQEPNASRNEIGLCDAVSIAKHAFEFQESSKARGVTGMAIGSKPHAIGLGLAALGCNTMEIVCRTPTSYKMNDVKPTGEVMIYEIVDRFDPQSYL